MEVEATTTSHYKFMSALISGGVAGLVVDIALFPIDTVKTRLQSERGFWRSGGFSGIYKGLAPTAAGSAPTAALFFCVYEGCKFYLEQQTQQKNVPVIHMFSASMAEIAACLIRVPVEIAKQRRQALLSKANTNAVQILWDAYRTEGISRGLYRGYLTTILREVPFSLIQFPLWEFFKANWTSTTGTTLTPFAVALCGACAGGISAAATTPLDLAKTRIMLADQVGSNRLNLVSVLAPIYKDRGIAGLFAGVVPRVIWITLGGAIFFGFYDLTSRAFQTD
ncbi:unnamed protein product [Hermetia illucens]|uniref:S-adenosylmethionine mitochondrial carrier protein n=1 Tax=Hermetia illucens TaxID=343691 RepID=A0A7R8Z4S6_HERIL|nr:S-adenosylmethionine mitochondrial carrier protein homolog [Hermetia illucens]CAD7093302.1 unnamed protein product [Hermetia illucens]